MVTVLCEIIIANHHGNATSSSECHLCMLFTYQPRRLVRQPLVQRSFFYWLLSHAVSYAEWHVDASGVFVALPYAEPSRHVQRFLILTCMSL